MAPCGPAIAAEIGDDDGKDWSVHGQMTHLWQYHPAFRSPDRGGNSLDPGSRGNETFDATLYVGAQPWSGAEIWINPEIDQGFGLSDTLGVAGFPSGEAYKVGKSAPYFRLQRFFLRQTFNLGGDTQKLESGANQLAAVRTADNIVLTMGKLSVTDIFDNNTYAHDPKIDFMNWAIVDAGAFDYAADAWGYSYGIAVEWTQAWWTLRSGLFDLSRVPNSTALETEFHQFELVAEMEERHVIAGRAGKLKLLGFVNRGRMSLYADAVRFAKQAATVPDTSLERDYRSKPGGAINLEQQIDDNLGVFARVSINDGSTESYEFTEIGNSVSIGSSLKGASWRRPDDSIGIAAVSSGISQAARSYFAAGGLGILIGDGRLAHYGREDILETYYDAAMTDWLSVALDYQLVVSPAYNRDRGPVSVFGVRLHLQQ